MSALGDYKYVTQDRLGSETPILADVIAMYADKAIDELWAENERLKCCGNCHWMHGDFDDCVDDVDGDLPGGCGPADPCHFTPSRWMRRDAS